MHKLLIALAVSSAVSLGGCNFVSQAHAMAGGVPLTSAELAKHNATLSKLSREAAAPKAVAKPEAKKPVVLHRAVVPQPKPAPQAKALDPVKTKPTILERFIALKRRWF